MQALRGRVQSAQADARDASASASASEAARQRAQRVSTAALDFAEAGSALSKTRSRMIDLLVEQIAAERASRLTTASSLISEYNGLVTTHNRQVSEANAALERLKSLSQ